MQKGSLEWQDYLRLAGIILVYWLSRPLLQRTFKRWSNEAIREGEEETAAYRERRAQAAAVANDLRSGKADKTENSQTLGDLLDSGEVTGAATSKTTGVADSEENQVKNRKSKKKGVSFAAEKTEEEKTLDWEDDSEFDPRHAPAVKENGQPQSGDIKEWMEKWTA